MKTRNSVLARRIFALLLAGCLGVVPVVYAAPGTSSAVNKAGENLTVEQINSAPRIEELPSKTEIAVGQRLNLQVTPRDSDNTVPLLDARRLPAGAMLTDNRDGSRSLLWKPEARQIGEHRIVFTAMDSRDPALRSEKVLILKVISAVAQ